MKEDLNVWTAFTIAICILWFMYSFFKFFDLGNEGVLWILVGYFSIGLIHTIVVFIIIKAHNRKESSDKYE